MMENTDINKTESEILENNNVSAEEQVLVQQILFEFLLTF